MQVKIDKFGRLLIPKIIRQHLGLRSGTLVDLKEQNSTLLIKAYEQESPLKNVGGVLVFTAEATENIENAVQRAREARDKSLSGFEE